MYQPNIHGLDDNEGLNSSTSPMLYLATTKFTSLPTKYNKIITLSLYKQLMYT